MHLAQRVFDFISTYPMLMLVVKVWTPELWRRPGMDLVRLVWRWTKWSAPIDLFLTAVNDHWWPGRIYYLLLTVMWVAICVDDDDEWWKRQARKALGVVRDLGHRLTVVVAPGPAGAPA